MIRQPEQTLFSGQTVIRASSGHVSCDLNGEIVLLEMQEGMYYSLTPVAARVWKLIQDPREMAAIRDAILEEYDVDQAQCERDLTRLWSELRKHNLARISHEEVH